MPHDIIELPQHVADLIAAGEVVERPASVIKELVENSIDAGAGSIVVEIQRGGAALMRVTDDGCGIPASQAATAFLRHATSKIRSADDLFAVRSLGFRGEALAAIAAVSRIDLITRERGALSGASLTLEAGRVVKNEEAGCPEGTTIIVRDLFFNTPARAKFMRRDSTEAAHVQEAVQRAALSHPEISVRLIKDGAEAMHTPGNGDLRSCIYSLLGSGLALSMAEVNSVRNDIAVSGFTGREEIARAARSLQIFMADGRPVRSRTLTAALEEAYKNELPQGRYPVCVLHLHLPPGFADVNVHPAKSEIKFSNDRAVFDALYFAVMGALNAGRSAPELKLAAPSPGGLAFRSMDAAQYRSAARDQTILTVREPELTYRLDMPRSDARSETRPQQEAPCIPPQSREETPGIPASLTGNAPSLPAETSPEESVPDWRYIGQALGGYLLVETEDALFMIDRHAAHERILFDRLRSLETGEASQQLMQPKTIVIPPAEHDALLRNLDLLSGLGFDIESFGERTLIVRGAPGGLEPEELAQTLSEIAETLLSGAKSITLRDGILHVIACKSAVKIGKSSGPEDMLRLAGIVMETPELRHCPHGRPVAVRLTRSQLERQFGR